MFGNGLQADAVGRVLLRPSTVRTRLSVERAARELNSTSTRRMHFRSLSLSPILHYTKTM
eukprot:TRINITY_DN1018_c0_g1_i1.p3 TRINITY_DN1018_c0_g1~~TRINITY_DN1018_c0_g1_i1.p3  ORF type:complete len:60 (+),score=1.75 TRINITY_DN1018_c0_g1_i1:228-407(+)